MSNSRDRIDNFTQNVDGLGLLWLNRNLPIRAEAKGISGLTVPGKESTFYIHPDEFVITQILRDAGLELRANKHTRYAQGLVKRLGSIQKVVSLIDNGGAEILSVLSLTRPEAKRPFISRIQGDLVKKWGFEASAANQLVREKISSLLSSELVRRGYCAECPSCNLSNWLLLKEISEQIECKGCAKVFQLPINGLQFAFEPNELAARLIQDGGLVVLLAASLIRKIPPLSAGYIQFGGDLFPLGEKKNTNEVDLFFLAENGLSIVECKSLFDIRCNDQEKLERKLKEVKNSVEKNIEFATKICAKVVFLGVFSNSKESDIPQVFHVVQSLCKKAKERNIGLHLILNNKIYLWGDSKEAQPEQIVWEDLAVSEERTLQEYAVGESPHNYGGEVGKNGLFDEKISKEWELKNLSKSNGNES